MMTAAQQIEFETKGFLVIPNALSGDKLAKVRQATEKLEAQWRADANMPGQRSAALEQIPAPIEYSNELLELLWHPQVFPLVRSALGNDVTMIDNDFFITPPRTPHTHAGWHYDVNLGGVYHPRSVLMVKVFFLLSDVNESSGGTALIPGSHRLPMDFQFPKVAEPREMPGAIQMTGKAGTAYLFNGRVYHCAVNNASDQPRRVLIYNYGHSWMKTWPGYEPSEQLRQAARASGDLVQQQLLGLNDPYGAGLPATS